MVTVVFLQVVHDTKINTYSIQVQHAALVFFFLDNL